MKTNADNASFVSARLGRSFLYSKGLFWSFLALLFVIQQSGGVWQNASFANLSSPVIFGSVAVVIGIGALVGFLLWDRSRLLHR